MTLPLLIQPPSAGRISGGFLFNARMAQHGLWELLDLEAARLGELDRISLSPRRAQAQLGWTPTTDLVSGTRVVLAWFREHR